MNTHTETKHTLGPWQSNQYGYIHAHVGYPRAFGEPVSETMVAVVASEEDAKAGCCLAAPMPEREANARLIAAAPELLTALQAILDLEGEAVDANRYGAGDIERRIFGQARTAIAKATQDSNLESTNP